jgi:probable HAF family extracellular repeat protein
VRVYQVEDLGFIGGSNYLVGIAMNTHGDAAGWATGADGVLRAFRWTQAGGLEDLGTNGGQSAMASAINDDGDVVGKYWDQEGSEHPFIAKRGGVLTCTITLGCNDALGATSRTDVVVVVPHDHGSEGEHESDWGRHRHD